MIMRMLKLKVNSVQLKRVKHSKLIMLDIESIMLHGFIWMTYIKVGTKNTESTCPKRENYILLLPNMNTKDSLTC
jgi:hypothetical protein